MGKGLPQLTLRYMPSQSRGNSVQDGRKGKKKGQKYKMVKIKSQSKYQELNDTLDHRFNQTKSYNGDEDVMRLEKNSEQNSGILRTNESIEMSMFKFENMPKIQTQ